jgi:hypothetical protein
LTSRTTTSKVEGRRTALLEHVESLLTAVSGGDLESAQAQTALQGFDETLLVVDQKDSDVSVHELTPVVWSVG